MDHADFVPRIRDYVDITATRVLANKSEDARYLNHAEFLAITLELKEWFQSKCGFVPKPISEACEEAQKKLSPLRGYRRSILRSIVMFVGIGVGAFLLLYAFAQAEGWGAGRMDRFVHWFSNRPKIPYIGIGIIGMVVTALAVFIGMSRPAPTYDTAEALDTLKNELSKKEGDIVSECRAHIDAL